MSNTKELDNGTNELGPRTASAITARRRRPANGRSERILVVRRGEAFLIDRGEGAESGLLRVEAG
jgi:hypothetical protein